MDSAECGVDENSGKSFAGDLIGTDSAHKKTHELLCQEYVLQTDQVTYRIRPKDEKHPVLLPVGEKAQFRMEKDKMVLRVEDLDSKVRPRTIRQQDFLDCQQHLFARDFTINALDRSFPLGTSIHGALAKRTSRLSAREAIHTKRDYGTATCLQRCKSCSRSA
jgi:hypothetical protein